jgi:hypothetical protein
MLGDTGNLYGGATAITNALASSKPDEQPDQTTPAAIGLARLRSL